MPVFRKRQVLQTILCHLRYSKVLSQPFIGRILCDKAPSKPIDDLHLMYCFSRFLTPFCIRFRLLIQDASKLSSSTSGRSKRKAFFDCFAMSSSSRDWISSHCVVTPSTELSQKPMFRNDKNTNTFTSLMSRPEGASVGQLVELLK